MMGIGIGITVPFTVEIVNNEELFLEALPVSVIDIGVSVPFSAVEADRKEVPPGALPVSVIGTDENVSLTVEIVNREELVPDVLLIGRNITVPLVDMKEPGSNDTELILPGAVGTNVGFREVNAEVEIGDGGGTVMGKVLSNVIGVRHEVRVVYIGDDVATEVITVPDEL